MYFTSKIILIGSAQKTSTTSSQCLPFPKHYFKDLYKKKEFSELHRRYHINEAHLNHMNTIVCNKPKYEKMHKIHIKQVFFIYKSSISFIIESNRHRPSTTKYAIYGPNNFNEAIEVGISS